MLNAKGLTQADSFSNPRLVLRFAFQLSAYGVLHSALSLERFAFRFQLAELFQLAGLLANSICNWQYAICKAC